MLLSLLLGSTFVSYPKNDKLVENVGILRLKS